MPQLPYALTADMNYCPNCGQENHDLKVPMGHMVYEVVEGFTHFDNKLGQTLKAIFTAPGKITADFLTGKRARYVPPVRLYIFVSVIFFFLIGKYADHQVAGGGHSGLTDVSYDLSLADFVDNDELLKAQHVWPIAKKVKLVYSADAWKHIPIQALKNANAATVDSLLNANRIAVTDSARQQLRAALALLPDVPPAAFTTLHTFGQTATMSDAQLDSLIRAKGETPTWLSRRIYRQMPKMVHLNDAENSHELVHTTTKNLSIVMFILMPFVAFLLLLFYYRRGHFYYEHLIFSIHIHTILFVFYSLALLVLIVTPYADAKALLGFVTLAGWLYFLLSLKRVYRQGWSKTLLKWVGLSSVYGIVAVLFVAAASVVGILTF